MFFFVLIEILSLVLFIQCGKLTSASGIGENEIFFSLQEGHLRKMQSSTLSQVIVLMSSARFAHGISPI